MDSTLRTQHSGSLVVSSPLHAYLPENVWALSFEELMRDYFCPQGYNASNPSCAIGICLGIFGTSHHVDDPVLAYYYYAPPAS